MFPLPISDKKTSSIYVLDKLLNWQKTVSIY